MMGMHTYIYKDCLGDCTNGGASGREGVKGFTVVNCGGPFEPSNEYPAAELVLKDFGWTKLVKLIPTEELEKGSWTMFGGNYAATSDSRVNEKIEELLGHRFYGAVAIHDRVEK